MRIQSGWLICPDLKASFMEDASVRRVGGTLGASANVGAVKGGAWGRPGLTALPEPGRWERRPMWPLPRAAAGSRGHCRRRRRNSTASLFT